MAADYKVTELFCVIDEFYKYFGAENAGHCTGKLLIGDDGTKRRRCKASLSDSEIMTILLSRTGLFLLHFYCLAYNLRLILSTKLYRYTQNLQQNL